MATIDKFTGAYRFLSNFHICYVRHDGITYPSTEHAYQAAKTLDLMERRRIASMASPSEAKRAGRRLKLRSDWESVKVSVMLELLRSKFDPNEPGYHKTLANMLLETGDAVLIEGNHWKDTFWGVCNGQGHNMLGKLLMQVRDELHKELGTRARGTEAP